MQLELDFTNKGWRRWAIDRCTRLRLLCVTEGGRRIRLNGSEAKILLYKIAEYDDCYASVGRLSDETGIAKRNIERLLKALRETGLLTIEPRQSDRGHFPTNRYIVFYNELAYLPEPTTPSTHRTSPADAKLFLTSPTATPSAMPTATPSAMVADNKDNKRIRNSTSSKSEKPRDLTGAPHQPSFTTTKAKEVEVEELFLSLGVGTATTLVAAAIARGCAPRSLIAIGRWYIRSQRNWPTRWKKPTSVLKIRLEAATPNLPAHRGWIAGDRPLHKLRPAKPKRDLRETQAEIEKNRLEYLRSGESAAELFKQLRASGK